MCSFSEIVKKKIEQFEQLKNGVEKVKENTGRVTRHAARNKVTPLSELQISTSNPQVRLVLLNIKT